MRPLNGISASLFSLAGLVISGAAFSLWLSQLLWQENNTVRVASYANSVLQHAERVASNLADALVHLEQVKTTACSLEDLHEAKKIVFEYRFVKDAGRIDDGKILCSGLWGTLDKADSLGDSSRVTKNQFTLWTNVPSYAIADSTIDVTASQHAFVVTSPTAFAPFETPPPELSALITSPDKVLVMRAFGQVDLSNDSLTVRHTSVCSNRFDICVTAQISSSIFSTERTGLLGLLSLLGGATGALLWYASRQLSASRRSLGAKLARATREDRIELVYQPILEATTGKLRGFEALARWNDKDLGAVPPDVFINKAIELNLSFPLSRNIVSKAMRECRGRLREDTHLYLSLNFDSESLLKPELIEVLVAETEKNGIATQQIAIEVLEGSTAEIGQLEACITRLRQLGFLVFIDDFGTGYSSLAYLSQLKVDKIKIDKSFTQAAGTASPAALILKKIHEIASTIDTPIIFEGVETEQQRQAILEFCPQALAQGWLFSKGVPIEQVADVYPCDPVDVRLASKAY